LNFNHSSKALKCCIKVWTDFDLDLFPKYLQISIEDCLKTVLLSIHLNNHSKQLTDQLLIIKPLILANFTGLNLSSFRTYALSATDPTIFFDGNLGLDLYFD
jgi:hypothetical protein